MDSSDGTGSNLIETREQDGVLIARLLRLRLDASAAPQFKSMLTARVESGHKYIVLDLGGVEPVPGYVGERPGLHGQGRRSLNCQTGNSNLALLGRKASPAKAGTALTAGLLQNGQLGLGADVKGSSESWTKVSLDIAPQDRVISVASGPRSSFTLVQ